ncbi:MAG TPA: KTSC domain-containing protein [Planctomycetota bacterium]|jgi:hypothetical protein
MEDQDETDPANVDRGILNYILVKSSLFKEVAYHEGSGLLIVGTHKGATLESYGVSRADYDAFMGAESKGVFHREVITPKYGYEKVN